MSEDVIATIKHVLNLVGKPIVTQFEVDGLKRLSSKLSLKISETICHYPIDNPHEEELHYNDHILTGCQFSFEEEAMVHKHVPNEYLIGELYEIELLDSKKLLTEHLLDERIVVREYTQQRIKELEGEISEHR